MVPCLHLRSETLLVDQGEGYSAEFREVDTAVIELVFDYGGVRVPASEPVRSVAVGAAQVVRDVAAESSVRRMLEAFGPVDLLALEDCATIPGSSADYAVHLEGDVDALCSFGAHAIPALRQLGWRVDVAEDYPCQVVEVDRWFADLADPDDDRGWFELELGVEVDGERIDLLPFLLDLIESGGSLTELLARRRRPMAVPLGGGRYVPIPVSRLETLGRVLGEMYAIEGATDGGRLRVSEFAGDLLDELGLGFEDDELRWGGEGKSRWDSRPRIGPPPKHGVAASPGLRATLRPYQEQGLAFLQNLRKHGAGGVLADDMGLGKTLQTIAHILTEKESGRMWNPTLVVAPTSLVGNWFREIRKFAPSLQVAVYHGAQRAAARSRLRTADVVITTYGLLSRERELFESLEFYLHVLDEAQAIKNPRSQAHRACKAIRAEYRLCISGTPVENNLDELWALFDLVMPGLLGDAARFRSAFRFPIERQGNHERLETLRRRVAPFVLRRLKTHVASELPPKTEILRTVELRDRQRDLYESIRLAAHTAVRKAVKRKGLAASKVDILSALMKLRQVCCDPRLVRVGAAADVEESSKMKLLLDMVPRMVEQGRKILVFSQFTSMLALIAEALRERDISHVSLTGATHDRQAAVDAFQAGQAAVFLVSLKAGGTGLNLTTADTVIHFDPWWNPAAQAQATDRAYRIGQTRPVFVYNLIVAGSVEERMVNLQRHKQALADGILADGDEASVEWTTDDVDDLFAPLAD